MRHAPACRTCKSKFIPVAVLIAGVVSLISTGKCATVDDRFNALFAADIAAAAGKSGASVQFARKLLKTASSLQDDAALRRMVLEKTYDYGMADPAGYATAIAAVKRDIDELRSSPENAADVDALKAKLLRACELQYSHGNAADKEAATAILFDERVSSGRALLGRGQFDEANRQFTVARTYVGHDSHRKEMVQEQINAVAERRLAARKFANLKSKLSANPEDHATAKELVLLSLLELEDAKLAGTYVAQTGDDVMMKWVRVCADDTATLEVPEQLAAAEWFFGLAEKAKGPARITALTRADGFLDSFLTNHTQRDGDQIRAGELRQKIWLELKRVRPASTPRIDLLRMIDPKVDLINTLARDGTVVTSGERDHIFQFPFTPPEEYDFEIVFTRVSGDGSVDQLLYRTQTKKPFRWIWSKAGQGSGLMVLTKNLGDHPLSVRKYPIKTGVKHRAMISVRRDSVKAVFDGHVMLDARTDWQNVEDTFRIMTPGSLGVIVPGGTTVVIESVELEEVSGKGRRSR